MSMKHQTSSSKHPRSFQLQGSSPPRSRQLFYVWTLRFLWSLGFGVWGFTAPGGHAQEWLDRLDDALFLQPRSGFARVDFSGTFDLEGYYIDQRPPGLIFGGDESFINPRLSLFLDAQVGKHFYSFVQARVDRGFDPRSEVRDARFDEYLLRYTPFDAARLNLQVGKFATVVGNWVARHDSWNNPFINAPLPYENVTSVADVTVTPGPTAFLARRDLPDNKPAWVPLVWGPVYSSGLSLFGTLGKWDYAVDFKNAALSSRPAVWDATELGWENPTVSARLGFRPDAAWNVGASFSYGAYLQPDAEQVPAFPVGQGIDDFKQLTLAADASFAWHHWQLWGEFYFARFEVPNVGDADTVAYYIEAKYKFTSRLFGALRWNQQFFGAVRNAAGAWTPWDRDAWRMDAALGCRFTRHWQGKLQYSYNHKDSPVQQVEQLVAAQVTLKF